MYDFFTTVLNMSITAGILALAVMVLRLFMKKAPKKYVCILWALVALRLICPVSISSPLSAYNLVNSETAQGGQIEYFSRNDIEPAIEYYIPQAAEKNAVSAFPGFETKKTGLHISPILYVWLGGTALMLTYALLSYIFLKRKVRASNKCEKNIYVCDDISTPFILGIIKPRIYLPTGLSDDVKSNVIAHELSHIKRLDYLWKPLGFILLSIYWFNPVLWVAYILLCKDIEGACDERVIAGMDKESVLAYSEALLACSSQRRMITACPVAFGETDVKGRIKNVLNYKKPAFWLIVIAIVACCVVAVCFLTNPKGKEKELSKQEKYAEYIADVIEKDLTNHYHFENVEVDVTVLEDDRLRGDVNISTGNQDDNQSYNEVFIYLKKNFDECRLVVDGEAIGNSFTKPPALTVTYGGTTIEAVLGTYSWHYETSDGKTRGGEADAIHPLIMQNNPVIALNPENESALLSFEAKPIEVKVYYWGEECLGDDSKYADFEELDYSDDTDSVRIPTDKGIIVMVEGTWKNGTALYSFRTTKENSAGGNLRTYNERDDGTWECDGHVYKYRLEITGRMPNAAYDSRFVFLSNIEEISFDRAWKAAGFSSNMDDYFRPEEAVLVEMGVLPEASGKESASLACTVTSLPESDVVSFACEDVTADGMKVNLINSSGRDLMYGRHFSVERHEDGEWMSCKVIEGAHIMSFTDEGIMLNASSILSVDWSMIYGTLQAGEYRLVLSSIYYWGDDPQTAVENPVIEFVIQ